MVPSGHGDIYPATVASGTLDALLGAGQHYALVSNSDNLGALGDVRIAAWLAAEQVPFALEAVRGTAADRKGGDFARHGSIPGARVVHVPRSRFVPVKTTNDLLVVRSDTYELTSDGT